ncbi:MAG: hypothetical protein V8Q42_11485 [Anaerovoracaceae bacterium]
MINVSDDAKKLLRNRPLNYRPVLQLDEDLNVAIKKMEELGRIVKTLPGSIAAYAAPQHAELLQKISSKDMLQSVPV